MILSERFPTDMELVIDGNSSSLNQFTPYLNKSIVQIAKDIDPTSESLRSISASMAAQLSEQVTDWSGIDIIVLARSGRELRERVECGDSSFIQIGSELDIHAKRIQGGLTKYQKATGPRAWKRRIDLRLMLRIDSLALLVTADAYAGLPTIFDDSYRVHI